MDSNKKQNLALQNQDNALSFKPILNSRPVSNPRQSTPIGSINLAKNSLTNPNYHLMTTVNQFRVSLQQRHFFEENRSLIDRLNRVNKRKNQTIIVNDQNSTRTSINNRSPSAKPSPRLSQNLKPIKNKNFETLHAPIRRQRKAEIDAQNKVLFNAISQQRSSVPSREQIKLFTHQQNQIRQIRRRPLDLTHKHPEDPFSKTQQNSISSRGSAQSKRGQMQFQRNIYINRKFVNTRDSSNIPTPSHRRNSQFPSVEDKNMKQSPRDQQGLRRRLQTQGQVRLTSTKISQQRARPSHTPEGFQNDSTQKSSMNRTQIVEKSAMPSRQETEAHELPPVWNSDEVLDKQVADITIKNWSIDDKPFKKKVKLQSPCHKAISQKRHETSVEIKANKAKSPFKQNGPFISVSDRNSIQPQSWQNINTKGANAGLTQILLANGKRREISTPYQPTMTAGGKRRTQLEPLVSSSKDSRKKMAKNQQIRQAHQMLLEDSIISKS